MRVRNKFRYIKAMGCGIPWLALFLALGCASSARRGNTAASTLPTPPVVSSAAPVKVEQDAGGFTITQSLPLTDAVRADYEAAVRMLEEGQYERGIALLLKVTEQAPTSTAAHIDLGIAYEHTGDLDHAEASLKRALELDPHHPALTTNWDWSSGARESFRRRAPVMRRLWRSSPNFTIPTETWQFCVTYISGITRARWSITKPIAGSFRTTPT